MKKDYI